MSSDKPDNPVFHSKSGGIFFPALGMAKKKIDELRYFEDTEPEITELANKINEIIRFINTWDNSGSG
jgi:hypothetical protein